MMIGRAFVCFEGRQHRSRNTAATRSGGERVRGQLYPSDGIPRRWRAEGGVSATVAFVPLHFAFGEAFHFD